MEIGHGTEEARRITTKLSRHVDDALYHQRIRHLGRLGRVSFQQVTSA
jgi:hypothetical protein